MYKNQRIWIIGASSGIGEELAKLLSNTGAKLTLTARNASKLEELNKELGSKHKIKPFDVSKEDDLKKYYSNNYDRIIFLAAIYEPKKLADLNIMEAKELFDINYFSALNLAILAKDFKGQMSICASVAGYMGLPNGQIYSSSKAALINLCETMYCEGRDIKLINPGFVKTRLTEKNNFKMPFIITPKDAAKAIAKGLNKKSFEITFPKKFTYILKFLKILPYSIRLKITSKL